VPKKVIHPLLSWTYVYLVTKKTPKSPKGEGPSLAPPVQTIAKGSSKPRPLKKSPQATNFANSFYGELSCHAKNCVTSPTKFLQSKNWRSGSTPSRTVFGCFGKALTGRYRPARYGVRRALYGKSSPSSTMSSRARLPKWSFVSSFPVGIRVRVANVPRRLALSAVVAGGRSPQIPNERKRFTQGTSFAPIQSIKSFGSGNRPKKRPLFAQWPEI
jgi:hypothetical protein